jgi:hypothetical protein
MHFPDLTPYSYYVEASDEPAVNIGWLDSAHDFAKGIPPYGFVDRLRTLSRTRIKRMRGFQICCFCSDLRPFLELREWSDQDKAFYNCCFEDGRFSSTEIRVVGPGGRIYASPVMLLHYIEAHGYLPPQEFIDAVMQAGGLQQS